MRIVETVVHVNDDRKRAMGERILAALGKDPFGRTVALLGLTFKPDTDDMRNAPSLAIVATLADAGVLVRAHDPEGMAAARMLMPNSTYCDDAYLAADGADAVVIVIEWDAFRALDLARLGSVMKAPMLIDPRNVYRRNVVEAAGFIYRAIGC